MTQYPETTVTGNEIGETFRFLRKLRGLKLREAAALSGLSITFLSDMERGKVRPSLGTIQALVTAYDAPLIIEVQP